MTKAELRNRFREKRQQLTTLERQTKSQAIADRFFAYFSLSAVRHLHVFLPIARLHEVDTMYIIQRIIGAHPHVQLLVPRTDVQTFTMTSHPYNAQTKLIENASGIPEPVSGEPVAPTYIDLIVLPLLAFDRRGYRVGYGKGFYDRFLAQCRLDIIKIGVSYENPVDTIADVDTYDVRMNFCVTPNQVWEFR